MSRERINKLFLLLMATLTMTGCATGFVQTSSTTFHGPQHQLRDSIIVMPIDQTQEGSLEFKAVSDLLLMKLRQHGYLESVSRESSKYVAFITYGIDDGTTRVSSIPLFGQTGGGTTYSSGSVTSGGRTGSFSGSSYTMPTYGLIGSMPVSQREYTRKVNVDIWTRGEKPQKVYEMRGMSSGSCGNINGVLPNILDAMFKNFPGESGKPKRVNVEWSGAC